MYFREMDPYLREAVEKWISKRELDETILTTGERRENFKKYCRNLTVIEGVLRYKGRVPNVPKIVPTPEQVWEVLDPIHRRSSKKHVMGEQKLVEALSAAGYAYPIADGGLASLVKELVN